MALIDLSGAALVHAFERPPRVASLDAMTMRELLNVTIIFLWNEGKIILIKATPISTNWTYLNASQRGAKSASHWAIFWLVMGFIPLRGRISSLLKSTSRQLETLASGS